MGSLFKPPLYFCVLVSSLSVDIDPLLDFGVKCFLGIVIYMKVLEEGGMLHISSSVECFPTNVQFLTSRLLLCRRLLIFWNRWPLGAKLYHVIVRSILSV